jgi:tRNA nucleotidyltransferase (CCA-adding enzyme)
MPDYMFLLESRLLPEQRAALLRVQELSAALGYNVYLTGGTVRDLITGASLRDLDFTVEGNPSKIARELEKGGAKVLAEDEKLRHVEIVFAGDCEGSIAAARDDHYVRPGTRPEIRWSTIMEDLRRRDFSLNAIAISLNPASRGLLLDPTNGLSDIERAEVRALIIHSFTNQPVRLLRVLRFAARMGFKLEQRTQEWFDLAIERDLQHTITPEDAGAELRGLAREENPAAILKLWEEHDLLETVHPVLAKKHPDYDTINRLSKVRDDLFMAGLRPRLATPMMLAILGRLKDREQGSLLHKLGLRAAEVDRILGFEEEAHAAGKELAGKKLAAPIDAFRFLEKMPVEILAHLLAFSSNSGAVSKIRAYLNKWRPLRQGISAIANELTAIGMAAGPKFDAIVNQVFAMQLTGKGKTPEEREKILRKLSGIKEQPKPKETKGKDKKGAKVLAKGSAPTAAKLAAHAEKTAAAAAAKGQKPAAAKKPEKKRKK